MADPLSLILSPLQRRLLGAGIACLSVLAILFAIGKLLGLAAQFLTTFSQAIWPLVIALILSFLLQPVCEFFEERLRLPRTWAIVVLYAIVVVVCAVLALIILPVIFNQLVGFIKSLPALWENATRYMELHFNDNWRQRFEQLGILTTHAAEQSTEATGSTGEAAADAVMSGDTFAQNLLDSIKSLAGVSLPALAKAGTKLQAFFGKVAGLAIIPVYLFYLLDMRRDFFADLRREGSFLPGRVRDDVTFLVQQFFGILVSFFRGQLLIGMILGVLMAIGFTLVGLKFGLLIGLMIGFLNVIPYLGTMIGLGVALPLAYFQPDGGLGTFLWVVGVFTVVQTLDGYFITPRIMGKSTGLHPMVVIFSIFFWGLALDGLLGMILAVPLTAFFVVFWRLLKTKYLPGWLARGAVVESSAE